MNFYCIKKLLAFYLLLSACSFGNSNSYGTSAVWNANNQEVKSYSRTASNNQNDSGSYTVGNGNSVDDGSGEFIVGNGHEESPITGETDTPLHLALEDFPSSQEITDIYVVGEPMLELHYTVDKLSNTIVISSESLSDFLNQNLSMIVLSEDLGAKIGPFVAIEETKNDRTISVPMRPLQRVSGYIRNYHGEQIGFAGTKFSAVTDINGFYEINGVPIGQHQILISNRHEKVNIPVDIKSDLKNQVFDFQTDLSINELCSDNLVTEKIKIDFSKQTTAPNPKYTEDNANEFKNKHSFTSVSKYLSKEKSTKHICDITITIFPNGSSLEHSNDLALMLNNNLLYTHVVEEEENKGILNGLNFIEVFGAIIEGAIKGIADIVKRLKGIPEDLQPLQIGIADFDKQSLSFNAFKSVDDIQLEVLCLKGADECKEGIAHVSLELTVINE